MSEEKTSGLIRCKDCGREISWYYVATPFEYWRIHLTCPDCVIRYKLGILPRRDDKK